MKRCHRQKHVNVSKGLVMLLPKKEPHRLRNGGKESLELLVVEVRKMTLYLRLWPIRG